MAQDKILIPVDFSIPSKLAAQAGVRLARRLGYGAHLIYVVEPLPPLGVSPEKQSAYDEALSSRARTAMADLVSDLEEEGTEITHRVLFGDVVGEIQREASEFNTRMMVIGSAGHGDDRPFFLGSVAVRLIRTAKCPVLVLRAHHADRLPADGLFRKPLVAIDYSRFSEYGIQLADVLSEKDSTIELYHVLFEPVFELFPTGETDKLFTSVLEFNRKKDHDRLRALAAKVGVERVEPVVEIGRAAELIRQHLEDNKSDLVVTGAHGREASTGLLVGTLADRLLRGSPAPVLFIPDSAVD